MRVCVAGAGAIGGFMGGRLAEAGHDVTLVTLGEHLETIKAEGLRIIGTEGVERRVTNVDATDDFGLVAPQDVIILAVKAHQIEAVAGLLPPLFHADTVVVTVQNGIPWWYFQEHGGELDGVTLERVDPGGVIAASIEHRRVIGSLAYFATDIVEPGVIHHTEGNRISFGEPNGDKSERVRQIVAPLVAAGFKCPITARFRQEIWVKLLGNVAFNPLSVLTGGTLAQMTRHPELSRAARAVMVEAEAVAARLGIELPISIDQRMAGAEKVGEHKTSMLQDFEAGRPMELEAVVGAVVELGDRLGVETPATRAVYACVKFLDERRAHTAVTPREAVAPSC